MRLRAVTVLAAIAALVGGAAAPALASRPPGPHGPAAGQFTAKIRYTTGGIPHILAHNWADLGFGYGYAFAKDNICTMANDYVTVEAQRSRYFGPKGSYIQRGNGFVEQQPRVRHLLPADHRLPHRAAPRAGPQPGREAARGRLRQGLQRLPGPRRRREGRPRPDLPRPGLGEADHAAGQLPALLPAHAGVEQRRGHQRHHRGGPAEGGPGRAPGRRGQHGPDRARARRRVAGTVRQARQQRRRDRVRGHPGSPRPAARQPALPVDRPGALLPGAAHDPRQDQRHRRVALRRPARPHRAQRERGVEPHRVDRVPVHPVPAHARQGPPDRIPAKRQGRGHDPAQGHRDGQAAGRQAGPGHAHALVDPLRPGLQQPRRHPAAVDHQPRRSPSATPTPTTSPGRSTPGSASTARRARSRCCRS